VQYVKTCGVAFSLDADTRTRLGKAGASEMVLATIEANSPANSVTAEPGATRSPPAEAPAELQMRADLALWESANGRKTIAAYEDCLQRFPSGTFASAARQEVERLKDLQRLEPETTERRRREKEVQMPKRKQRSRKHSQS
jgi:hypothetical protein